MAKLHANTYYYEVSAGVLEKSEISDHGGWLVVHRERSWRTHSSGTEVRQLACPFCFRRSSLSFFAQVIEAAIESGVEDVEVVEGDDEGTSWVLTTPKDLMTLAGDVLFCCHRRCRPLCFSACARRVHASIDRSSATDMSKTVPLSPHRFLEPAAAVRPSHVSSRCWCCQRCRRMLTLFQLLLLRGGFRPALLTPYCAPLAPFQEP